MPTDATLDVCPQIVAVAGRIIVSTDVQKRDRIVLSNVDKVRSCTRTSVGVVDVDVVAVLAAGDAECVVVIISTFVVLQISLSLII